MPMPFHKKKKTKLHSQRKPRVSKLFVALGAMKKGPKHPNVRVRAPMLIHTKKRGGIFDFFSSSFPFPKQIFEISKTGSGGCLCEYSAASMLPIPSLDKRFWLRAKESHLHI